jgi:hypothetical protein
MQPEPTERDRPLDPGAKLVASAASRQKRGIDALDVNPAILHCFNVVRDFDHFTRGGIGIGEEATLDGLYRRTFRVRTILSALSQSGLMSAPRLPQAARRTCP